MADNDRFKIEKVKQPIECKGCEYDFETCEITCIHNYGQGKTRAEYEQELAELIYKDVEQIVLETINETTKWKPSEYFKKAKSISKKTVDRLFGEGL